MNEITKVPESVDGSCSRVVLADTSGSMRGEPIRRLRRELGEVWGDVSARLIAFDYQARWVEHPSKLPEPGGGTNLADAILLAASVAPPEVLVISDGLPDDEDMALSAAEMLPGIVSVIFVGDESDMRGYQFLQKLAAAGGGVFVHHDMTGKASITGEIRKILALPPPISL